VTSTRAALGFIHTFAGGDLDRASHLRVDGTRIREILSATSAGFLPFRKLEALVEGTEAPRLAWRSRAEVVTAGGEDGNALFLGLAEDGGRFAIAVPGTAGEPGLDAGEAAFRETREVAPLLTPADASILALGRSLLHWNATHGYCPTCGQAAVGEQAGHARRCSRSGCGTMQFPRTDPVVIMLLHRDGECLLGRSVRARRYPPGLHSCLAGYVEPGESLEEAVRRETWEEAGLRVDRVRYHSSQPWPFPSTLMIGCFAHVLPGDPAIDPAELESVRWFTREELQRAVDRWDVQDELRMPPPLTIAHQLARVWLAGAARSEPPITED
jgi:NAD+ diphosphatase